MSSFDKVVKLACKPKAAPPKAKVVYNPRDQPTLTHILAPQYLDPIVAATWNEDGAVHDVCKALVPRLREPNAVVRTDFCCPFLFLTCRTLSRSRSRL